MCEPHFFSVFNNLYYFIFSYYIYLYYYINFNKYFNIFIIYGTKSLLFISNLYSFYFSPIKLTGDLLLFFYMVKIHTINDYLLKKALFKN